MMRLDLLRGLPPKEPSPGQDTPAVAGGPFKHVLAVLLLILVGGVLAVWWGKPEWVNWDRSSGFWAGGSSARSDSLLRIEARNLQVSRLVEARQAAAIEWLAHLEALLSGAAHAGSITLTRAAFSASGEFALEGTSTTAEALSALQEGLVLVPGLDLRESRATETAGAREVRFDFKFSGHIRADSASVSSAENSANSTTTPPVRNRVQSLGEVQAALDTLIGSARAVGLNFAEPGAGTITRSGDLTLHAWRLKGLGSTVSHEDPMNVESSRASPVFSTLRELFEQERFRGSPFAIQRAIVHEREGTRSVFLDILALTP